ncbi:MAG: flagellar biosynthetic protein FliO [Actinomycetota bacterium]|nr:flagellar biosynthetic protein FliO [Actinomycetota bacterium]
MVLPGNTANAVETLVQGAGWLVAHAHAHGVVGATANGHVAGSGGGARLAAAVHRSVAGSSATGASTVSAGGLLLQVVLGLGVIVALVLVGSRFVRGRANGGVTGAVAGRRRGVVTVLGRQTLGKGVSVAVVEVAGRAYLLGVTPNAIRRLGEADAELVVAAADRQGSGAGSGSASIGVLAGSLSGTVGRLASRVASARTAMPSGVTARASGTPGVTAGPSKPSAAPRTPGPAVAGRLGAANPMRRRSHVIEMVTAEGPKGSRTEAASRSSTSAASGGAPGTAPGSSSGGAPKLASGGVSGGMSPDALGRSNRAGAPAAGGTGPAPGTISLHRSGTGKGSARVTTRGARPAPTWTSAIEHLRERTVRRA